MLSLVPNFMSFMVKLYLSFICVHLRYLRIIPETLESR